MYKIKSKYGSYTKLNLFQASLGHQYHEQSKTSSVSNQSSQTQHVSFIQGQSSTGHHIHNQLANILQSQPAAIIEAQHSSNQQSQAQNVIVGQVQSSTSQSSQSQAKQMLQTQQAAKLQAQRGTGQQSQPTIQAQHVTVSQGQQTLGHQGHSSENQPFSQSHQQAIVKAQQYDNQPSQAQNIIIGQSQSSTSHTSQLQAQQILQTHQASGIFNFDSSHIQVQ